MNPGVRYADAELSGLPASSGAGDWQARNKKLKLGSLEFLP
jgi:hypothetical protein